MKKMGLMVFLVLVVLISGCYGTKQSQTKPVSVEPTVIEPTETPVEIPEPATEAEAPLEKPAEKTQQESEQTAPFVKEFTMTAQRFSFNPSTITVNKGDTVRISITSTDVTHGFAISEFGINVQLLPGKTEIIEFIADKTGTFRFYCSVPCGSGHGAMSGKLIVK